MCATKKTNPPSMPADHKTHLPNDLGEPASLLTDGQIREAEKRGFLFWKGFSPDCVRFSSYELRASEHVEKLGYAPEGKTFHQKLEPNNGAIVIEPGASVRIFCREQVSIPFNVYGRVTVLGQLFSDGLAGGNTYLDPGFRGELYVVLANISAVTLSLSINSPIARLEFEKLGEDVQVPHGGSEHVRPIELKYTIEAQGLVEDQWGDDVPALLAEMREVAPTVRFDKRILLAGRCIETLENRVSAMEKADRQLRNGLVYHRTALYTLAALLVGVAWVALSMTTSGRTILQGLVNWPPWVKFIIPVSISTILLFIQKEVRRVAREFIVATAEKWRESQ